MEATTNAPKSTFPSNASEPISGVTGDVSKGEPYDAGNMDAPKSTFPGNASEPVSGVTGNVSKGEPYDAGNMEPNDQERVKESMEEGDRPDTTNNDNNTGSSSSIGAGPSSGSKGDNNNNDDDNEEKSAGTGEQYVKTSGFAADGGDFDAAKPGAGREADRLMEQKDPSAAHSANTGATQAPQNPSGGGNGGNNHAGGDSGSKAKEGMMDKLKHKLHKH